MSVSSSTRCDAVSVSSQMDTHIAEVQAGVTLSVNALEFWHARGPSRLARLVNDLICAPALQAYVERMFSVCLGDEEAGRGRKSVSGVSVQVLEISICLNSYRADSGGRNVLPTVNVFQRLAATNLGLM